MVRVTVDVTWRNAHQQVERRPVSGWTTGVPGLVIVPGAGSHERYQLVHQASGLRIPGGLSSRRAGADLAERLRPVADWTLTNDELRADEGFGLRVGEALGIHDVRARLTVEVCEPEASAPPEPAPPAPVPEPSAELIAATDAQVQQAGHRASPLKPSGLARGRWVTWCGACERGLYLAADGARTGSLRLDACR